MQQVEPSHWVWNLKEVTSFNVKPTGDKVVIPQFQSIVELVSRRKPVEASLSNEKLNVAEEIAALKKQVFFGATLAMDVLCDFDPPRQVCNEWEISRSGKNSLVHIFSFAWLTLAPAPPPPIFGYGLPPRDVETLFIARRNKLNSEHVLFMSIFPN